MNAQHALAAGWPLAVTVAALLVQTGVRARRRRGALNRALHELRRPLQALVLANGNGRAGEIELALAALDELDHEINGGDSPLRLRPVACRPLLEGALARWRAAAGRTGSPIELSWAAGEAMVLADPRRLAQALDNVIVNALEHGGPPIRVEAAVSGARLRIAVIDGGNRQADSRERRATPRAPARVAAAVRRWRTRGRRGRGLEVVARIATEHGGRFVLRQRDRGAVAALELPLAALPAHDLTPVAA